MISFFYGNEHFMTLLYLNKVNLPLEEAVMSTARVQTNKKPWALLVGTEMTGEQWGRPQRLPIELLDGQTILLVSTH